ncbi:DNA-directed RNA polymerase Rpb11, 13-16kDa subunit, conserved site [Kalmanozyma brasiliensis GHG001]|uniref:RNA polymerase, subunit L n=1 Tax=Kalmanozyma brasiliensis (strain GHG001) TaxID=1365824 RepID=V5ELB9_KALBG|nr:DNA-directed RNA polymerase Rpb11, 13-16kDa subunit, conserved site [Kalmanozyma brasiliensis GHG001]EST05840.1 DNA-directed RNA polymerase Rpb11, 13-16kDa subunit, conserved site [Kalmanozyma brasiliensis GHG001]
MTNAPNRFDLFILGPDEKRVEVVEDTKIPNAATFWFNKEDHTLGNLLRHAVLANPAVLFCGYKVPHPLEPKVFVKIQTDGSSTPTEALKQGCQKLIVQISGLKGAWRTEVQMSGAGTVDVGGYGRDGFDQGQGYGGDAAGGYVDI